MKQIRETLLVGKLKMIVLKKDGHVDPSGCLTCGEEVYPPFMTWRTAVRDFNMCGACCNRYAHGMICDLLAMKAQHQMSHIVGNYALAVTHVTLPRQESEVVMARFRKKDAGPK